MDGIQVHKSYAAPAEFSTITPASLAINPAAVKTTSHYLRALRRRFWMVLSIAVPLAIAALDPGAEASAGLPRQG